MPLPRGHRVHLEYQSLERQFFSLSRFSQESGALWTWAPEAAITHRHFLKAQGLPQLSLELP